MSYWKDDPAAAPQRDGHTRKAGVRFLQKAKPHEQVEHALMALDEGGDPVVIRIDPKDMLPPQSYNARFHVHSASSGRLYVISWHPQGWWGCSCPSWTTRRHCKHLKELGIPGFMTVFRRVKIEVY